MRRINTSRFAVAKRGTSREINRRIVLNLVRSHQPISRADLARLMGVSRGTVTLIVNDLIAELGLTPGPIFGTILQELEALTSLAGEPPPDPGTVDGVLASYWLYKFPC